LQIEIFEERLSRFSVQVVQKRQLTQVLDYIESEGRRDHFFVDECATENELFNSNNELFFGPLSHFLQNCPSEGFLWLVLSGYNWNLNFNVDERYRIVELKTPLRNPGHIFNYAMNIQANALKASSRCQNVASHFPDGFEVTEYKTDIKQVVDSFQKALAEMLPYAAKKDNDLDDTIYVMMDDSMKENLWLFIQIVFQMKLKCQWLRYKKGTPSFKGVEFTDYESMQGHEAKLLILIVNLQNRTDADYSAIANMILRCNTKLSVINYATEDRSSVKKLLRI
jgi:hypothetical protein